MPSVIYHTVNHTVIITVCAILAAQMMIYHHDQADPAALQRDCQFKLHIGNTYSIYNMYSRLYICIAGYAVVVLPYYYTSSRPTRPTTVVGSSSSTK